MSLYLTGLPVPSDDPRDFSDNTQILDLLMMMAAPTVLDRLGSPRKTWWQIEQDAGALSSPNVTALAALVGAANKGFYFSGTSAMSTYDLAAQGRTFLAATTQAAQRAALQLVKTTSATDTTAGSMLQVGDGGLLSSVSPILTDIDALSTTGFYRTGTGATGNPVLAVGYMVYHQQGNAVGSAHQFASPLTSVAANKNRLWHRQQFSSTWTAWEEFAYVGGSPTFATLTLTGPTNNAPAQSIASAATVNLAASTADTINVTGTVTITGLGNMPVGTRRRLIFAAALTLTNNAAIVIPGGANITTAAGDVAEVESTGASTWRVVNYQKANGQPTANVAVANGGTGGTSKLTAGTALGVSAVGTNTTELAQSAMVQNEIANKRAWTAYTPVVSATTGSFTAASATGKYMVAFGICHIQVIITITTKGTGTLPVFTLPFNALTGSSTMPLPARESALNGKSGSARIDVGLGSATCFAYDVSDLATGNGSIIAINGSYPIA